MAPPSGLTTRRRARKKGVDSQERDEREALGRSRGGYGTVKRHPDLRNTATPDLRGARRQAEPGARTARVRARSDRTSGLRDDQAWESLRASLRSRRR